MLANCFGGHGIPSKLKHWVFAALLKLDSIMGFMGMTGHMLRNFNKVQRSRTMLVHSTFGLDAHVKTDDTINMVGPSIGFCAPTPEQPSVGTRESAVALRIWLAQGDGLQPIVYVSTGSMGTGNSENMQQMAAGLMPGARRGEYRLLWSLKKKFWASAGLSEEDSEREWYDSGDVFICGWLPQDQLLRRDEIKVFVTHGGWGGTTEGLLSGTPLVVMPFFGDQPSNGDLVQSRHFGQTLRPIKGKHNDTANIVYGSADIRKAVDAVLADPSYAEAVAKCATAIKGHDSPRVLCEAVEQYCCCPQSGGQPVASAATSEAELRAHEAKLAAEVAGVVDSSKGFLGRLISFISNAVASLVS